MTSESHQAGAGPLDDLIVIEPTQQRRPGLVGMPGRFMLNRHRDRDGRLHRLECSILKMSPMAITFKATVQASVGDWVVASFDHLGRFEGPILRIGSSAVSMRIVATQQERDRVAAKIAWIDDKTQTERRRFARFVPNEPQSTLSLDDGQMLPCTLIDYSVGGAAVFADVTPAKGTALKIAQVVAQVVRHFEGGFAVNFAAIQDARAVESLLHSAEGHAA